MSSSPLILSPAFEVLAVESSFRRVPSEELPASSLILLSEFNGSVTEVSFKRIPSELF